MSAWTDHVAKWRDCQRCPLCRQRDRICLARGTIPCDILFVGEAPGASEDAIGQPFVGPAGNLLNQIIERALLHTTTYALTNLVACFPAEAKAAGDNEPGREEIDACRPRLVEFINIVQPRLVVCVGQLATQHIDHSVINCTDMVHPAYVLRRDVPLVKKQSMVNHMVVVLRNAVEAAMSKPHTFKSYGTNARFSKQQGLRQRYDAWVNDHADIDIPF